MSVVLIQIHGTEVFTFEVPDYSIYWTTRSLQMILYDGDMNDNSVIIGVDVTERITGSLFSTLHPDYIYLYDFVIHNVDFIFASFHLPLKVMFSVFFRTFFLGNNKRENNHMLQVDSTFRPENSAINQGVNIFKPDQKQHV